jgi:hypothetical protein
MKVSAKVKTSCYAGMNFGTLFFSAVIVIQGVSIQRSLIIYIAATVWINLMLWVGFRMRDKGSL